MKFNREEELLYNGLETAEAKRRFMQIKFKTDFKEFIYLLGYRDLGKFHDEEIRKLNEIRIIDDSPIRNLWLWSRGFFKTSIITIAHSAWLIVNNLDIRILLVSYTLDVAISMLKELKSHWTDNADFRYFFREYCPSANTAGKIEFGTSEYFIIPNRRKKHLKEPTIMCAGVGTNLTGRHFDYSKIDDLVTRNSVTNDTQIQISKDYYSSLRQLFDKTTCPREDVVGTIYHFNDLHRELEKNNEFTKSIIPVHDKNNVYAFAERIDEDGFKKLQNDSAISPYDIASQYLLIPHNPKDAVFKEEWWQEYDKLDTGLAEYICVDPASTRKKKSDYTVMERWGINFGGQHFLIEALRDKLSSFQRVDRLFEMVRRSSNLQWVKYEVLGGRHGDLEMIKKKQADDKLFFIIKETKSSNSSKEDRIMQRLSGPWHAGIIFMPHVCYYRSDYDGRTYDFVKNYKLEFLQFSPVNLCEHDDCLDTHSQMFESVNELSLGKGKGNQLITDSSMTMGGYIALKENRITAETSDPWHRVGLS